MKRTIMGGRGLLLSLTVFATVLGSSNTRAMKQQSSGVQTADEESELATIGSTPVTRHDVEQLVATQLQAASTTYEMRRHELLSAAVKRVVRERLLESYASTRNLTREQVLDSEIAAKIDIADDEIAQFHKENQARMQGRTLEQIGPQIRKYLTQQRRAEAEEVFFSRLEADNEVVYRLEPFRVAIANDGRPSFGPDDAPVTVTEFSDFECPYCVRFTETIALLKKSYGERVRFVFRQFPLDIHPNARPAAEASLCASEQGQFWAMHDLMFAEQGSLTVAELEEKAKRLNLDDELFGSCLKSGQYADQVQQDLDLGTSIGVSGTPAVFVNGRPLEPGAVAFERLAAVIDEELRR